MTSYVENETEVKFDFDIKKILDQVMTQILDQEKCPYEAQVNLLVTDNEGIREYNRKYREIDAATDVLSFPMKQKLIFLRQRLRKLTALIRKPEN